MTWRVAARVLLLIAASALIWAGVAFVGYGLLTAFQPALSLARAALAVGAILLFPPLIACVVFCLQGWRSAPQIVQPDVRPEDAGLSILAGMAKERPFLALLVAGLMGAAGAISQRKFR